MSCVYCEPKSRTRIFSAWMSTGLSVHPVVRGLLRDDHVVDVALAQARLADPDEARLLAQLGDRLAAEVSHAAAQPAHELQEVHLDGALVRHAPLDALGHELVGVGDLGLEVAIARSLLHRADGPHAPVRLVAAALVEDDVARRLLRAGEERADHHAPG